VNIELIYYPPYHSKYNPIERCWAALEQFWNGAILDGVETAMAWAENMSWKGLKPLVHHVTKPYEKGIKVDTQTLATYKVNWHPSEELPKWSITIDAH